MTRPGVAAQFELAPCGIVDGFDWPVPEIDLEHPDFAVYRARFGGLHTGIDVAFEQLGMPVRAAARGLVTYSDPAGWTTEKGVVVIQHTLPGGTLVNSLYGHMEEVNGYFFPAMNECVERGEVIGAIGFPSRGRPHLHYEIRTRYRHEGGPGYTATNPLELGWLHPLDFTYLARVWVSPAYRAHFTLTERPTLPPLPLRDGTLVIAHSGQLVGIDAAGQVLWRFDTLGSVTGMLELTDGRVLALNSAGQVLILNHGAYSALYTLPEPALGAPRLVGERLVVITQAGSAMAFAADGTPLWTVTLSGPIVRWDQSGDRLALGAETGELRIVAADGNTVAQRNLATLPIPFATTDGGFVVLSGTTVARLNSAGELLHTFDTAWPVTAEAALVAGPEGALYLYAGEGRALYAFAADGNLQWIAYMPGSHVRPPLLGVGGGALVYALTFDGQLVVYDAQDGHMVASLALYHGGVEGTSAARWLVVDAAERVQFSSGYLSTVTLDGSALLAAAPD